MIEYGLLFGLGFLTAVLVVFLLAPAIHRRIVKFTENRILATVPVSPQELRAQKDMIRAEMAVAIARTGHDLKLERHKGAQLSIANDKLSSEASRLYGENADLRSDIEETTVQASELRSSLRNEEIRIEQMKEALASQQHSEHGKDAKIEELKHLIQRLDIDIDNLKIDLVTRDTEAEGLKARINGLRDEREALRNDLKQATQRAKDAELKLAREENRANRLEERLSSEVSGSVDKDTIIDRRVDEINRLKERLKNGNVEKREESRGMKAAGGTKPAIVSRAKAAAANLDDKAHVSSAVGEPVAKVLDIGMQPARLISDEQTASLMDEVRGQASAAGDMLLASGDEADDDILRSEIADIAAKMIAITGQKEGANSPILSMLSGKAHQGAEGRLSLSERASKLIHQE